MANFQYRLPTKVLFGKRQIAALRGVIPERCCLLLTRGGGRIRRNGVDERARRALQDHSVFESGGIEPNPARETLLAAI